ncbi:hypothetical protein ACF09J_35820 [Streptomyces sp. NPDC014889]|uniref:hypothetical protein n=1 Tax=Streptomyces sp. NPDC014889 TaxID=3364928 RepID=UPI0037012F60
MDAGLAAVLGAVAGAVGTALAGASTGWASQQQAKIAARSAHQLERRQSRETAYRVFIRVADTLHEHVAPIVSSWGVTEGFVILRRPDQDFCEEAEAHGRALRDAWLEVSLLGPSSVLDPAVSVLEVGRDVINGCSLVFVLSQLDLSEEPEVRDEIASARQRTRDAMSQFGKEIQKFGKSAQQALDDDGAS